MNAVLESLQPQPTERDPLDQYLDAGVPLRVLLEHGASRLDWLTELEVQPIVMVFRDINGRMVTEEVDKFELLERAHELGWKPSDDFEQCIAFESVFRWWDESDEEGSVPGHWFAHESCVSCDEPLWGVPLTLPPERFAAIEAREKREAEQRLELNRKRAEDAVVHAHALAALRLIKERIDGRRDRDVVRLTYTQAWEEVEAITAIHGFDPWCDEAYPPFPWTEEQKHEIKRALRCISDISSGKPVQEAKPLDQFLADEERGQ